MNTRISMIDVIRMGASRRVALPCAHCGTDAPLASQVAGHYVIACQNDDCPVDVQASADTLEGVWLLWNKRS